MILTDLSNAIKNLWVKILFHKHFKSFLNCSKLHWLCTEDDKKAPQRLKGLPSPRGIKITTETGKYFFSSCFAGYSGYVYVNAKIDGQVFSSEEISEKVATLLIIYFII